MIIAGTGYAAGEPGADDGWFADEPDGAFVADFMQPLESLQGLDWEEEYPRLQRAIENLWSENGWNDEADRFAHDLACDVTAIPPWEFMKRVRLVTERFTERYELRPEQVVQFQGAALTEIGALIARHPGVIMRQTRELIDTRIRKVPFTSEQVARWTKESEALFADSQGAVDRFVKNVESSLEPSQREIFRHDVESLRRRRAYFAEARGRWAGGKWQAKDWGMQDDPIQRGEVPAHALDRLRDPWATKGGRGSLDRPLVMRWLSHDPSTWYAYVVYQKRRLDLDPGQLTTARSIHAELLERGNQYMEQHAAALQAVPVSERPTHEAYRPIRLMFVELQTRLKAMSTTVQRQQADE